MAEINKSLQSLMQQMSKEQNVDQLLDGISTTVEGVSLFAAVIKPAKRARFQNAGAAVAAAVNEALNVIVGLFSACWNQITSLWNGLIAWFDSTIIQPLIEKISGVREWIKQLLESIKQTASDMVYNLGVMIGGSDVRMRMVKESPIRFRR